MTDNVETSSNKYIITLNKVDWLTLSGVVTTWFAIMLCLYGKIYASIALLFIAMLADAFDGILARKYGTERNFGRYLDGFMDVLIYLVSPCLILYTSGFSGVLSIFLMLLIAAGCVRLSVFNDVGNIEESDGLSYLGMPVFWSIPITASYLLLAFLSSFFANVALAIGLVFFSYFMLRARPFFKFTSLYQILSITLGGFTLFLTIEFFHDAKEHLFDTFVMALFLIWPIIIGGVLHMIVVSKDAFAFLKIPINKGLFGENKTLRGFVVVPLFTVIGFATLLPLEHVASLNNYTGFFKDYNFFYIGAVCGLLYVVAELPNSFLKRRMGVAPGETPDKFKSLFILIDQLDSALFISIGYLVFFGFHWTICIAAFVMSPLVALIVKAALFKLGLKKTRT